MRVVIVDTGCANFYSLASAIRRLGVEPVISDKESEIRAADRIFLPGVGTARAAMEAVQNRNLVEVIREATQPVLGICLGEQLLATESEESPGVSLLGVVSEEVRLLKTGDLPLPHMGWNRVTPDRSKDLAKTLFAGIPDGEWFYFVHSFAIPCCASTLATAEYGEAFSAAVGSGNFAGVQFHPERSGKAGAKLIANFLGVAP